MSPTPTTSRAPLSSRPALSSSAPATAGTEEPPLADSSVLLRPKVSYWRKLGGGSLTISIIVHAIFLAVGLVWVLAIIPPEKEKIVDFKSSGEGGGAPKAPSAKSQQRMANASLQRVSAVGMSSSFSLPEPSLGSALSSLGSLAPAGGGGIGGSGSGGGEGAGKGRGLGAGIGDGIGNGPAGKLNPFGMLSLNPNALVGTFYDLKQTDKKKPTNITNEETLQVINDFVKRGWKETALSREYFQAPQKLYQTKIYIPMMQAEGAPAAFNCEKDVQPSRWVIVYRGTVTAPKAGKYRFVGAGDDVMIVRFNNKHVFDHGFASGTTGKHLSGWVEALKGKGDGSYARELRDSPMKIPISFYQYDTTRNWNEAIGGLAVGPEFEVKAGASYPIEILLSEIPGGLFCAALMIEQVGETYQKASTGAPILPVFRLDFSPPAVTTGDNAPPFDPDGKPWRIVEGTSKMSAF